MSGSEQCKSKTSPIVQGTVSVAEILHYVAGDRYLAEHDARRYLSLSERKLRNHLSEIKHYRIGRKLLFKKSDLDRWMERFLESSVELDLNRLVEETMKDVLGPRNN